MISLDFSCVGRWSAGNRLTYDWIPQGSDAIYRYFDDVTRHDSISSIVSSGPDNVAGPERDVLANRADVFRNSEDHGGSAEFRYDSIVHFDGYVEVRRIEVCLNPRTHRFECI